MERQVTAETVFTDDAIRLMVDGFYERVRRDPELGPVFEAALGGRWAHHMPKMYDFWSAVLLTNGRYKGAPMQAHQALPPFPEPLFDRWLALFEAQLAETFAPDAAGLVAEKARRIARSLRLALYFDPAALPRRRAG